MSEDVSTTGAVSQRNSGGVNVANTGTIETLVINVGNRPPEQAPWMVPSPPGPIVRRPELVQALRDALLSGGDGPVALTTALQGAGGFGKTTLATDLCLTDQRVRLRFAGGLIWVTLGQRVAGVELAAKVNGLCELLTGQACTAADPEQAGFRLGALLSQRADMLMVIDDVWTSAQLAPFLLGAPRCRRLVTTRDATVLPRGTSSILVDAMNSDEAMRTLTQGLPDLPQPTIDRLVRLTGRWPVLMSLVNAAMAEYTQRGAGVAEAGDWVIERLVAGGPTALDIDDASSREHAVEATVAASLDLISPQARERYLDLAIFPEDVAVPGSVLAALWSATGGLTRAEADRLAARLTSLRLVTGTWRAGPAVTLHDVLRGYLRHRQGTARLAELNRALVEVARSSAPGAWWLLPEDADYLWRHLTYHLAEAGADAELTELVCDVRWLLARIDRHGPVAAGGDLALSNAPTAVELRRVIGQQAHLLGRLQPSLADTLLSRIPVTDGPQRLGGPRLLPHWPLPDLPDPDLDRTLEGHTGAVRACAAAPDGRRLASAGFDHAIRIWDIATGSTRGVLTGHTGWIWQCAWTPDGMSLVSASDDGTVRRWDVSSGDCRLVLSGHENAVTGCAVSPDGTWLASTGVDGTVRIWDTHSGDQRTILTGHEGAATSCATAPDGTWLASTGIDGTVRVWDARSRVQRALLTGHVGWVNACAVSPDGTLLVTSGADHTVRVWDPATGQPGGTLFGDTGAVNACTVGGDTNWIAAGGADTMVRVWRPRPGQPAGRRVPVEPVRECAAFPDGGRITSVSTDGTVRLWEVATATESMVEPAHTGVASCCAVAPDGSWFVSGGYDGLLHVWDAASHALRVTLTGHTGWVTRCAVAPDGTLLASVSDDGTLRLWDPVAGTSIATLGEDLGQMFGCAFSPDGATLASTGSDRLVRLWDVASRTLRATLAGHTNRVNDCRFSADGTWLASAGFDGTIRTWDTATGAALRTMSTEDGGAQWGCAISPDDAWIAGASTDRTIRIWDARTGECRNALRVEQQVWACAWLSDSRLGVAGDAGVYLLDHVRLGAPDR